MVAGGSDSAWSMEGLVGLPGKKLSFSRGDGAKWLCTALTVRRPLDCARNMEIHTRATGA